MKPALAAAVLLAAALPARAQRPAGGPGGPAARWSVGLGIAVSERPYLGAQAEARPLPMVSYRGPRLTVAGPRASWLLAVPMGVGISAFARPRFGGVSPDDSPRLAGIRARKSTLEAGLDARLQLPWGFRLRLESAVEVLGRHGGLAHGAGLSRSWRMGPLVLTPELGAAHLGRAHMDYYYGVSPYEAAAGRPPYRAGGGVVAEAGFSARLQTWSGWGAMAGWNLRRLPDQAASSPIVERRTLHSAVAALSYAF